MRNKLNAAIKAAGVGEHAAAVRDAAEPAIELFKTWEVREDPNYLRGIRSRDTARSKRNVLRDRLAKLPLGASRLGGLPDLPPGFQWPRVKPSRTKKGKPLSGKRVPFVAQLNLATLPHWKGCPLPETGWLYVFVFQSNDAKNQCHVIYHDGPRDALARDDSDADDIAPDWAGTSVYQLVEFEPEVDLSIDWEALGTALDVKPPFRWVTAKGEAAEAIIARWDAGERSEEERVVQFIPSFPKIAQQWLPTPPGPPLKSDLPPEVLSVWRQLHPYRRIDDPAPERQTVGQLVGQVTWDEDTANTMVARERGHNRQEGDWINLLEVRSVGSMMWSDVGYLNLLIRRPALAAGDFSDVLSWVSSS